MLQHLIKLAWRNTIRNKTYTVINMVGLALGLCGCIVIYFVTSYDLSFDTFHQDKERIYRIGGKVQENNGTKFYTSDIPPPSPDAFRAEIPGFETVAKYYPYFPKITVHDGDKKGRNFDCIIEGTNTSGIVITDSNYFAIFKYEWLTGDPVQSLNDPFKVVISESRARKYFGLKPLNDIIGKEIVYNDSLRLNISGIVKDWNKNTDFPFTDFISFSTIQSSFLKNKIHTNDWGPTPDNRWVWSFVKLSKAATPAQIKNQLAAFINRHIKIDPLNIFSFQLQPLSDIHFNSDYDHEDIRKANLSALYGLMAIALFILSIAVINFINLATAQSVQRAKEIGVRKVLGSGKTSLRLQFITETFVLVLFAACIALTITKPVLWAFRDFIPAGVKFNPFNLSTLSFVFLLTMVTTLLASFYPANVLSAYLPVMSLKGAGSQKGGEKWWLRRGLIVFQFTISLFFVISTIIVSNQIRFMLNTDYGFKTDAIVTVNNWDDQNGDMKVLAGKIKRIPGIEKVILQANQPLDPHIEIPIKYKGRNEIGLMVSEESGNEDFIPFYEMKLIAGRNLMRSDSLNEYVINETYSKALGFKNPEEAVGKFLYWKSKPYPIIGVVADFHQGSFHESILPEVIGHIPAIEKSIGIKLATRGKEIAVVKKIISQVEKEWKQMYPGRPFNYSFLDDSITSFYKREQQTAWLMNVAMSITIFVSCMGLFGLTLFTAEQKAKEIGIRKVLGASVATIILMLCKDFITLTLLSLLLASPISWYFMNNWLQNFAYRIHINWWIFLLAGLIAIMITLITISYQAIKAAIANPVKCLRSE